MIKFFVFKCYDLPVTVVSSKYRMEKTKINLPPNNNMKGKSFAGFSKVIKFQSLELLLHNSELINLLIKL